MQPPYYYSKVTLEQPKIIITINKNYAVHGGSQLEMNYEKILNQCTNKKQI